MERKRSNALRGLNQAIGQELGHFEVEDPDQTYVRQVSQFIKDSWRFRIHLPEGSKYNLGVGTIGLKKDGVPDYSLITRNQGNFSTSEVESDGQFSLVFSIGNHGHQTSVGIAQSGNSHSVSIHFDSNHINNIIGQSIANTSKQLDGASRWGKHGDVLKFSADEPIVLFQTSHAAENIKFRNTQLEEVFVVVLLPSS